jgi:adenylate cyclase
MRPVERDRAKVWVARALAIDPDDLVTLYIIACVYSNLGELDPAIDLLEKVLPYQIPEMLVWFRNDSDLDAVRGHPRFQKLLETVGTKRTTTT